MEDLELSILEILKIGGYQEIERILIKNGDDLIEGFKKICEYNTDFNNDFNFDGASEILDIKKTLYKKTIDLLDIYLNKNLSIQEAYEKTNDILQCFLFTGKISNGNAFRLRELRFKD